jgi:hypothetical protein
MHVCVYLCVLFHFAPLRLEVDVPLLPIITTTITITTITIIARPQ